MAMGRRAKKPAAEKPFAPGARNISLYGFDTVHSFQLSNAIPTYVAYVIEIMVYATYVK
jgi:hypothetical protein